MFKPRPRPDITTKVKGFRIFPIQYEDRLGTERWSSYFGKYENQKYSFFDTDSCWALSAINSVEDQLEWLWKNNQFSQEAKDFFTKNKYIDADGDFSLSERFLEIKGGEKQSGGTSPEAWQLMQKWGCIPRSLLNYSVEQVEKFQSNQEIDDDYFNPQAVTKEMEALGQQFLKYVNIAYQTIGRSYQTPNLDVLKAALKQAPLCIGIPIPTNVFNYNLPFVQYDGTTIPAHEIELYDIDDKGRFLIYDQYEPHLKTLSPDYLICFCTQGIAYSLSKPPTYTAPVLTPQQSYWGQFWSAVNQYFNGIKNPFPIGSR